MRRVATVLAAGLLALTMLPSTVAADTTQGGTPPGAYSDGMTITITSTRLIAKVIVEVNFDLSCSPKPEGTDWEDSYFSVWTKQASGRAIATGSSDGYWAVPVCDGSPHTMSVAVPADQGSVPFKNGTAVVAVSGSASFWGETCDEYWNCTYIGGSRRASTGWVTTRLSK